MLCKPERHSALLQVNAKIGSQHLPMSITIMEKGPDFLFGLDMLRRYQCSIDLKANVLRFSVQPEARDRLCMVQAVHGKRVQVDVQPDYRSGVVVATREPEQGGPVCQVHPAPEGDCCIRDMSAVASVCRWLCRSCMSMSCQRPCALRCSRPKRPRKHQARSAVHRSTLSSSSGSAETPRVMSVDRSSFGAPANGLHTGSLYILLLHGQSTLLLL